MFQSITDTGAKNVSHAPVPLSISTDTLAYVKENAIMTDPYVSGDDVILDRKTTEQYRKDRIKDDCPDSFPGYPYLRRFAQSDQYGDMELLSVDQTSDGFLIGWARVHIGTEEEHEHSVFLG